MYDHLTVKRPRHIMNLLVKTAAPASSNSAVLSQSQPLDVKPGQVLVKVTHTAFTSNNVSYALAGRAPMMKYFDFFPVSGEEGSGHSQVPTWGLATVVATRHPLIKEGELLYGFLPYAQYVVLEATTVTETTFADLQPHRKKLAPVYNSYSRLSTGLDPLYRKENALLMILLRPLFVTSWLLADFVASSIESSPAQVIITSASSKTSYGLAFLLKEKKKAQKNIEIIGLTSKGNLAFTTGMGVYDRVVLYGDVVKEVVDDGRKAVAVDMAGNRGVIDDVLQKVPACQVALVGTTNKKVERMPGKFFFAPTQAQAVIKRFGGAAHFNAAVARDWNCFVDTVRERNWCHVEEHHGPEAARDCYNTTMGAAFDPTKGIVLSLWDNKARL